MTDTAPTGTGLKATIRTDLTAAMKARDKTATDTLRMALTAITNAEVAGDAARELADDEVTAVLAKELRKRHEAIEVYRQAGRDELAEQEEAEAAVLARYLPTPLTADELGELVADVVAELTAESGQAPGMKQMGVVIKAVKSRAGARAEGGAIAQAVKAALG